MPPTKSSTSLLLQYSSEEIGKLRWPSYTALVCERARTYKLLSIAHRNDAILCNLCRRTSRLSGQRAGMKASSCALYLVIASLSASSIGRSIGSTIREQCQALVEQNFTNPCACDRRCCRFGHSVFYDPGDFYRTCRTNDECSDLWDNRYLRWRSRRDACDCDGNCCPPGLMPRNECPERLCPLIDNFYMDACDCLNYCCQSGQYKSGANCELRVCKYLGNRDIDGCLCERECCRDPETPPAKPAHPSHEFVRMWYACDGMRNWFLNENRLNRHQMPIARNGTIAC